jgi:hypothetical protein
MFGTRSLAVRQGTVDCPLGGPTDPERCLDCVWLASVDRSRGVPTVRCRPLTAGNRYSGTVSALRPD